MSDLANSFFPRASAPTPGHSAASPALAREVDDIPVLTDSVPTIEAMISELSRRIETRIAKALPELIGATVREYLAEQAKHNGQGSA